MGNTIIFHCIVIFVLLAVQTHCLICVLPSTQKRLLLTTQRNTVIIIASLSKNAKKHIYI